MALVSKGSPHLWKNKMKYKEIIQITYSLSTLESEIAHDLRPGSLEAKLKIGVPVGGEDTLN